MSRLVALYPAAWRARYEDEFRAVLAVRPPSIGERLDIVRGAVDARVHPQLPGPQRMRDPFGLAPFAGFASLVLALFLMANGPERQDEYGTYRDGAAGLLPFVVAFALLSVGFFRVVDRLPVDALGARAARAAGWTAVVAGPIWSVMPWMLPIGLVFILALAGLAVGARRAGIWPTWSVVALIALVVPGLGVFVATLFLPWYALRGFDMLIVIGPLAFVWLVVGSLVTRGVPQPARS